MKVMPDFVNLAKSPEQINQDHMPMAMSDYPVNVYPYGTSICLENAQLERLNLDEDPEVGDMIEFTARGLVTSASQNQTDKGTKRRVEIQITDIALDDSMSDDEDDMQRPSGASMRSKMYNKD